MKRNEILDYLESTDNIQETINKLTKEKETYNPEEWNQLYDGEHGISNRPPKMKKSKDKDGQEKTEPVYLNKIELKYQKKLVNTNLSFLFGDNAGITGSTSKETDTLKGLWKTLKLQHKLEEAVERSMVETKSALFINITKTDKPVLKKIFNQEAKITVTAKVLSYKNNDEFWPVWDDSGDMVAFVRKYKLKHSDGKEYNHTDVYTDQKVYHYVQTQDGLQVTEKKNIIQKIPVIYFEQEKPVWDDVQSIIDRLEWLLSKFGDSNDYFAFPALVARGNVQNLPDKGEVGKLYQVQPTQKPDGSYDYSGGVDVLSWDQSPDSIEREYQMLKDSIFGITQMPDLSFNNVKGIGSISGVAMRLMFLDAHLKARENRRLYGASVDRTINLLKTIASKVASVGSEEKYRELDVSYDWGKIIPEDVEGMISTLVEATGGKAIMSQKKAVSMNPYQEETDIQDELDRIKDEDSEASGNAAGSFNL